MPFSGPAMAAALTFRSRRTFVRRSGAITSAFVAAMIMIIIFAVPRAAEAWGNDGHTWINEVAAQKLPASMPLFLRRSVKRLGYLGPEPDRWRNAQSEPQLDFAQAPDHFINLERVPAWTEWPRDRYRYIRALEAAQRAKRSEATSENNSSPTSSPTSSMTKNASEANSAANPPGKFSADDIGFQPYAAIEVFERLKVAFREYRRALKQPHEGSAAQKQEQAQLLQQTQEDAIFYAGWLGHYVGDGSQPLHTSIHYDGWVGDDPNGYARHRESPDIHSDFETRFVKENESEASFAPLVHAPVRLTDPFNDYVAYLRESQKFVEPFYRLEKAGAFEGHGTREARDFTAQRLAAGAQMLANLWYTAWLDSREDEMETTVAKRK